MSDPEILTFLLGTYLHASTIMAAREDYASLTDSPEFQEDLTRCRANNHPDVVSQHLLPIGLSQLRMALTHGDPVIIRSVKLIHAYLEQHLPEDFKQSKPYLRFIQDSEVLLQATAEPENR